MVTVATAYMAHRLCCESLERRSAAVPAIAAVGVPVMARVAWWADQVVTRVGERLIAALGLRYFVLLTLKRV